MPKVTVVEQADFYWDYVDVTLLGLVIVFKILWSR